MTATARCSSAAAAAPVAAAAATTDRILPPRGTPRRRLTRPSRDVRRLRCLPSAAQNFSHTVRYAIGIRLVGYSGWSDVTTVS